MFSYFIFSLVFGGIIALPPPQSGEYVNPITTTSTKSNCYEVEEMVHVDRCETYMNREVRTFFNIEKKYSLTIFPPAVYNQSNYELRKGDDEEMSPSHCHGTQSQMLQCYHQKLLL